LETSEYTVAAGGIRASVALRRWLIVVLCLAVWSPSPASGQSEGAAVGEPVAGTPTEQIPKTAPNTQKAPNVDLGRLLKLPDSYQQPTESRRGMGQSEWDSRFEVVQLVLNSAQLALEKAQTDLGEVAGDSGQWSVAAPGTTPNPENTPLSYKLRQEIRRQREEVERAERQLRALEIEADLAEVPAEWRAPDVGRRPKDSARTPDGAERVTQ
jgi:hypothetical protein